MRKFNGFTFYSKSIFFTVYDKKRKIEGFIQSETQIGVMKYRGYLFVWLRKPGSRGAQFEYSGVR